MMLTQIETNAQDILGKWYGIGKSYLSELSLGKDSVKVQIINSRHTSNGNERGRIKHFGIDAIGGKIIVIIEGKSSKEELCYQAMTLCNIQEHQSIELAANGQTASFKTMKELRDAIEKDTTKLFGNVFYSEKRIQELENLKDPETMPLMDFRSYLKKFVEKRDSSLFMEPLMEGTFHDQIVNKTLIELGYNPLFRKDWENRFFDKYLSDKEVEEIYRNKF